MTDEESLEEQEYEAEFVREQHARHFEGLVRKELHDLFERMTALEDKMADFDTAMVDLLTQVKDVGTRVAADMQTLRDEVAASGVATTAKFQAAADSIEAAAAELAKVDAAAPAPIVIPPAPATEPSPTPTPPNPNPDPTPTA